jgi:hypothetical protein
MRLLRTYRVDYKKALRFIYCKEKEISFYTQGEREREKIVAAPLTSDKC